MSRRTSVVRRSVSSDVAGLAQTAEARPLSADVHELEAPSEISLPRDHPRWQRDRFTISAATKALIDRLRPIAIRVFGFWDHRTHRIDLENATIEIDPCGSYRCA